MQRKYLFWTKVLSCLLLGLTITSFLIPAYDKGEDWIPLLSGFFDMSMISGNLWVMGGLGALFNILIVVSLTVINAKSVNNVFNPYLTTSFFLLLILLDPQSVWFSSLHPAVLLFVWGQFCFIINQKFTSMFLLSCAALFYAPLLWVLPIVWVVSIMGAADVFRVAVKSIGGILLPPLYLLCFRFMMFGDAGVFVEEYLSHAMAFSSPMASIEFTTLFLVLCIAVISLHAVSYIFSTIYSNSIVTGHILKMEFMCFILGSTLFILFSGNGWLPVNMIAALPLAMIFSYYFTANINAAAARIELILLCCAAILQRLSYFI